MLFDLPSQAFEGLIRSAFEGIVLVLGKKLLPRHIQFDLHELVLILLVFIKPQKHLPIQDIIVKGVQFVGLFLNEINQLLVCVKVNGMHL